MLVAKNHSLLIAEVARCKKLLVTRCKVRSLLFVKVAHWKISVASRCEIRSLLVTEVARCKKLPVTRCRSKNGKKTLECHNFHFTFCVKRYEHTVRVKPGVNSQLSPCNLFQLLRFAWLPIVAAYHRQSTEILDNFFVIFNFRQSARIYFASIFKPNFFTILRNFIYFSRSFMLTTS